MGSILNQIFRPSFQKRLKSVRIIAFAFFFHGGVPKTCPPMLGLSWRETLSEPPFPRNLEPTRAVNALRVAKSDKELLGARSEAAITEEFGVPAAIGSKCQ
jgi:hypothetical protein